MKSSHLFSIFLCLFSAAALAQSPAKVKLALNWKPEPQFGGFYAAQLNGEFKKRGLDVEILEGGSGTPTVQMLGAGKVDFAIVSAEEIIVANDRGAKITGIFATYQTNPQAIMTHQERGFKSLKDVFESKGTLALQSGLSYAQFLKNKYPNPKVVIAPYSGGITSFLKDNEYSQQCFFTSEPLVAEKAGKKVKTFLVSEEGFNPYTTVLAVRAESLKNPKIAKDMVEAVRAGWEDYLNNPEATNKYMAGLNKSMDAETFAKSAAAQSPLIENAETKQKGLGTMTETRWQSLLKQLMDLKIIKKKLETKDLYQVL